VACHSLDRACRLSEICFGATTQRTSITKPGLSRDALTRYIAYALWGALLQPAEFAARADIDSTGTGHRASRWGEALMKQVRYTNGG
jgi:hypothetical protein